MDRGAWWATVPGIAKELDTTWQQNSNNNNSSGPSRSMAVDTGLRVGGGML